MNAAVTKRFMPHGHSARLIASANLPFMHAVPVAKLKRGADSPRVRKGCMDTQRHQQPGLRVELARLADSCDGGLIERRRLLHRQVRCPVIVNEAKDRRCPQCEGRYLQDGLGLDIRPSTLAKHRDVVGADVLLAGGEDSEPDTLFLVPRQMPLAHRERAVHRGVGVLELRQGRCHDTLMRQQIASALTRVAQPAANLVCGGKA